MASETERPTKSRSAGVVRPTIPQLVENRVHAGALRASAVEGPPTTRPRLGVGRVHRDHLATQRSNRRGTVSTQFQLDAALRGSGTHEGHRLLSSCGIVRHLLQNALRHVGGEVVRERQQSSLGLREARGVTRFAHGEYRLENPLADGVDGLVDQLWHLRHAASRSPPRPLRKGARDTDPRTPTLGPRSCDGASRGSRPVVGDGVER